jgi:concanavalin A-like lectin/glucanase superfamily protein
MKRLLATLALILMLAPFAAQADISTGLVLWYPLDNNNYSANPFVNGTTLTNLGSTGTAGNGTTQTNGTTASLIQTVGRIGQGTIFRLDTAGCINIANSPTVHDFTVSAWIQKSTSVNSSQRVWSHQNSTYWGLDVNNGQLTALDSLDGVTYPTGAGFVNVADGKWHLVEAVRDTAAKLVRFYVDGKAANTIDISASSNLAVSFTGEANTNGGISTFAGCGESFQGTIDDLRVYSRALSPQDIWQLYQTGYHRHLNPLF